MSAYTAQQALAGTGFIGATAAAGIAIPVSNTTSQTFLVWNPTGSGINVVLDKFTYSVITLGTSVLAGIGLGIISNAGSQIATGSPISTATLTTPVNMKLTLGSASKARFSLSATTTAATFLMTLNASQGATTAQPVSAQAGVYDFDGSLIIPQGVAIVVVGSAAPVSTYWLNMSWVEVPA